MKYLYRVIIFFVIIFSVNVRAETRTGYLDSTLITVNGQLTDKLNDNNYKTFQKIEKKDNIEITSTSPFSSVYIIYYMNSAKGTMTYDVFENSIGSNGFLHEFISLDDETSELQIVYDSDVTIKEIFVFGGNIPDWVQDWESPHEEADLMLITAHSDDEHIFFAGLIPKMVSDGKKVQMVYLTRHVLAPIRFDELLNGLWTAGLRNYPIIGIVKDKYSTNLDDAIKNLSSTGSSLDEVIKFEVDTIRRFKPKVVVTHDFNGEYGHGQHRLAAYVLKESIKYFMDESFDSPYEPYEPYKIYIHLYDKNKITMNYDVPLDMFGGKTAYRVSMDALSKHESQLHLEWSKWIKYDSPTVIQKYNPMYFGLYYSIVGYNVVDNDMFNDIPVPVVEPKIVTEEEVITEPEIENKNVNKLGKNHLRNIMIIVISILVIMNLVMLFKILL